MIDEVSLLGIEFGYVFTTLKSPDSDRLPALIPLKEVNEAWRI